MRKTASFHVWPTPHVGPGRCQLLMYHSVSSTYTQSSTLLYNSMACEQFIKLHYFLQRLKFIIKVEKMPLIEVGITALASLMILTLTFNPLRAMVMNYWSTKVQGQRPDGSKDRVETNGRTDTGDCIISLANAVNNNN